MDADRSILIRTWSEETADPVEIRGSCRYYIREDRRHVLFDTDNDRCRISFTDSGLVYKRQGELAYELNLMNGEETTSTMHTAYGTMSMVCNTISYELSEAKDAIKILITYNMAEEYRKTEIIIKTVLQENRKGEEGSV